MRILLIGAGGLIGSRLRRKLNALGELVALDRSSLDLSDQNAIRRTIRLSAPNIIVNAAAYTNVDAAEGQPELAMAINALAPGIMAEEAERAGAALIHYSTDYVFSGCQEVPYREDDLPDPINAYGISKLAGEKAVVAIDAAHLILRTSWVFGVGGQTFMSRFVDLALGREELTAVDDQFSIPNWGEWVAGATAQMITILLSRSNSDVAGATREVAGIYHLTGSGSTTPYGFAEELLLLHHRKRREGLSGELNLKRLIRGSSDNLASAATRPPYSVLDNRKTTDQFGITMPEWREQLALASDELFRGTIAG